MVFIKRLTMQGFKSFPKKTDIIFDKGINVILGPNGSGKSCSYDTIVTLSDGHEIELGKLVEGQVENSQTIKKLDDGIYVDGDGSAKVISLNKKTMKSEAKSVSKFIKREGEIIYKIKTASGRELKATGCHPVMIFKDREIRSTLIRDLSPGKLIAVPRAVRIESSKNDEELSRLIGYIIGDGYIAQDRIEFTNNDIEVIEDYKQLLKKFSLGDMRERFDKNVNRIYIRENAFVNKIRNLFYENYKGSITSAIKNIPSYFMMLDDNSISNLLSGLFDTDGSVRKDVGVIEYCTKNKSLARQIQFLLLRFGITSKVKMRKCRACNTLEKIERDYYYLYISGKNNLQSFYKNIKLRVEHKRMNLENHLARNVVSNPNVDVLPQEINLHIKELTRLLGIKIKKVKSEYPSLAAYTENRCAPTRIGINNALKLFNEKLNSLILSYGNIVPNQLNLIDFMDQLNVSSREASQSIKLHPTIIRNQWATEKFNARPNNLQRFHHFITNAFRERLVKINELMTLLKSLANSDIFWDKIVSIEKLNKEAWVYDLTVEGEHNFIANNIFAHNSNISDALCFALGRLSVKSMRAAKTKNLLFMGSKYVKPSNEAVVELVFDNSDGAFAVNSPEISLKRIVRRHGQSVYKINDEAKTRGEIIELLAQAGIDPYGFNMVLQGQIQSIVRMHPEERRKIIEEVSGISIYEVKKEKSLHELEKTEERLKEISSILREKNSYLKNLENDRAQALKFKELENTVRRCKLSILNKKMEEKKKELDLVLKHLKDYTEKKDDALAIVNNLQNEVNGMFNKVEQINKGIQKATGVEQETLHGQIADLRAEVEGLRVRKESYENRRDEIKKRVEEVKKNIIELRKDIASLKESSPMMEKKMRELKKKKEELVQIGEERKKLLSIKTELNSLRERVKDKEMQIGKVSAESDSILKQMEKDSSNLSYKDEKECQKGLNGFREELSKLKGQFIVLSEKEIEINRSMSVFESVIQKAERIKEDIQKIDVCPLCQSKMTESHIKHVLGNADKELKETNENIFKSESELNNAKEERKSISEKIKSFEEKISCGEIELVKHNSINEKKTRLKELVDYEQTLRAESLAMEKRRKDIEEKIYDLNKIEEDYDKKILEIEEISSRTESNVDDTLLGKEREIEGLNNVIKRGEKDIESLNEEVDEIAGNFEERENQLEIKEVQERELNERFRKMFAERDLIQVKINEQNAFLVEAQGMSRHADEQINMFKIGKAKLDAECESVQIEMAEYPNIEIIQGSVDALSERLNKSQTSLMQIGSINLKALEVYDEVKKGYDLVQEKVNTMEKEKQDILAIVSEIDGKKRREFMKTFRAINAIFTENFSRLYSKGVAYLEIENQEDLFAGGVNIVVRLAKGKFFDVTSLSGGEQTLVALSLLFAIQEHKPYHFYIFDEIDAALDKRNSERLAALLKQYMTSGQYIVVTHNDAIIHGSDLLYGVSMQDAVSKVLNLKIRDDAGESIEASAGLDTFKGGAGASAPNENVEVTEDAGDVGKVENAGDVEEVEDVDNSENITT